MNMVKVLVPAFLAFTILCSQAQAGQKKAPEDEARAQFDAGVSLFERGQFAQASVAFARAYELRPSFKILYLVGKCENEQGHFALSLDAYTRYLGEGGEQLDAARRDEVNKEIDRLEALVGSVVIEVDSADVVVFVDGRKVGVTPLENPLFVDLGEHEIKFMRDTEEVYREIVKVAGGQRVVVKVGSKNEAAEIAVEESSAPKEGTEAGPSAEKPKRVWTWVAVGLGGAAAIGAAVTGALAITKNNDLEDHCPGNTCPTLYEGDADTVKALGNTTTALIAVAGVGIAAGIVLFFVEPKWKKGEGAVEATPVAAVTPDGAAVGISGRF
jgi:hypothetical protein